MSFCAAIGRQLRCPHGFAGWATGLVMRMVNVRPNELAVAALALRPADNVLEVGCGPGHAIRMMTGTLTTGTVHAVDLSPVMLAQARERNRAAIRAGKVRLYRAAAEQLPFADASMDKALAVNVAYFWRETALDEIRRVLRPGGVLAVYVTDALAMRYWPFAGEETHRLFDREELARCFRRAGLSDDEFAIAKVTVAPRIAGLIATTMSPRDR